MVDTKMLCTLIEERKDELFSLLSELIKINSENFGSHGNEEECAKHISKLCQGLGLDTDVYSPLDLSGFTEHADYIDGRGLENRFNVTARWKGECDEDALMLMGHSDTVPIGDPANWSCDPLSGDIRDGKIWGRGACDDKYAIATALFLIKLLRENGFVPKKNLLFTAYCDEEVGGSHGALASALRYPCERIVNMDCKNFEIWHCASGGQECTYHFSTSAPVDSAQVTAKAFPIIMEVLDEFKAKRTAELDANRFYKGTVIPATALRYLGFRAGNRGTDMGIGEVRFVFYTDKSRDEIYTQYREMEAALNKRLAFLGIEGKFVPETRFFHYAFAEPDCEPIRDMQAAALEATGREVVPCGSCLSDLSVILKYGSRNAYAFGIGRDFDAYGGAHQPDEHIGCDELTEYAKIIAAYILKVLG